MDGKFIVVVFCVCSARGSGAADLAVSGGGPRALHENLPGEAHQPGPQGQYRILSAHQGFGLKVRSVRTVEITKTKSGALSQNTESSCKTQMCGMGSNLHVVPQKCESMKCATPKRKGQTCLRFVCISCIGTIIGGQ